MTRLCRTIRRALLAALCAAAAGCGSEPTKPAAGGAGVGVEGGPKQPPPKSTKQPRPSD